MRLAATEAEIPARRADADKRIGCRRPLVTQVFVISKENTQKESQDSGCRVAWQSLLLYSKAGDLV